MTKGTTIDELTIEAYMLLQPEIDFLVRRRKGNRLAQALLLKYFQENSRFPEKLEKIPSEAINWVAAQLAESPDLINQFGWYGRTGMRFRILIRDWLGFQPTTVKNQADLRNWLVENALPKEHRLLHLEQVAYQHLKEQKMEPPTEGQMRRLTLSAIHQFEQQFFAETAAKINVNIQAKLKQLVHKKQEIIIENVSVDQDHDDPANFKKNQRHEILEYGHREGIQINEFIEVTVVMVTLLALFAEIERDFISLRMKEALTAKKAQGIILGKPKGTIQSSMYDKDKERIKELHSLGVPQKRIVEHHLGYGTTKSLSYYIRTRKLHKQIEGSEP